MKIQIDTTNKTLTVEGEVLFNELVEELDRLFPNNTWKEYKLIQPQPLQTVTLPWSYPVIQPYYQPQQYTPIDPLYPSFNPFPTYTTITCGSTTGGQLTSATDALNKLTVKVN